MFWLKLLIQLLLGWLLVSIVLGILVGKWFNAQGPREDDGELW